MAHTITLAQTHEAEFMMAAYQEYKRRGWYDGRVNRSAHARASDHARTKGGLMPEGTGDCYAVAGRMILEGGPFSGLTLVHGEVTGRGKVAGIRFGHAWVEDGDNVLDFSNGHKRIMARDAYYALGDIVNSTKYDAMAARNLMLAHEHFGPW